MSIENRVIKLEDRRREQAWIRVMNKYPEVSAADVDQLVAGHLYFATWTPEQLEAFAVTGAYPDGKCAADLPELPRPR